MEFMVLPYKDQKDVYILGGTDDIQVLLDDSNINIQTIASSRHVGPIKPRVEEWVRQLDLFGKTLVSATDYCNGVFCSQSTCTHRCMSRALTLDYVLSLSC